jgi:protein SCO1
MKRMTPFVTLLVLLVAQSGYGHDTTETSNVERGGVGIEEKTGGTVPPDLTFRDENGSEIRLGKSFGKPVLLTLVYYTCEHICPLVLSGLAQAVPRLAFTPGKDYRLITVSFDETDTPKIAREIKKNYIKAAGSPSGEEGWQFLVGDRDAIGQLTKAVGFTFRKEIHGFDHPVVLILLTAEGKISQYVYVTKYQYGADYPIAFSSFDLNMGLTQAAKGKEVTGITKALLYCFSHEPPGQSKFFAFLALVGLFTLAALAAFFIYLQMSTRRYRRGKAYDIEK